MFHKIFTCGTFFLDITSGEMLSFKYYSNTDDTIYDIAETEEFVADMFLGDVSESYIFTISTSTDISVPFSSGWNWFSINVEGESMNLNSVLASVDQGIYIKSQNQFSDYYPGYGWYGGLDEINVENTYKINLGVAGVDTMLYSGTQVDPSSRTISLSNGWNWIGYLPSVSLDVNYALGTVTNGIYLKRYFVDITPSNKNGMPKTIKVNAERKYN